MSPSSQSAADRHATQLASESQYFPPSTSQPAPSGAFVTTRSPASEHALNEQSASTGGALPKQVLRPEIRSVETEASTLRVAAIPNPARDRAELHVWTAEPGTIRVTVWSTAGELVGELPMIEATEAGNYALEVDVRDVRPGAYVVRAESGRSSSTTSMTVVR